MAYMCMNCFETYVFSDLNTKDKYGMYSVARCPKTNCFGDIIEIDELMLLPITILNKKGYMTEFCCAGHYYDNIVNTYIKFSDNYKFPHLPKGFKLESESYNNTIRKKYDYIDLSDYERCKEIIQTSLDLLEWVDGLDEYKI